MKDHLARIAELEQTVAALQREVAQLLARVGVFRSEPLVLAIGKLDATLNGGGQSTMTVWRAPPANGGSTGPGYEVKTKSVLDVGDWMMGACSGRSLATGTRVVAAKIFGSWYVIAASCC